MKRFLYILFFVFFGCTSQSNDVGIQLKLDNLRTFAEVYGYVTYFHPSDAASQIDWTAFSIYGAQIVEPCKSKEELISALNTLFKPIAPSINFTLDTKPSAFDIESITPKNIEGFKPTYWQHSGVGVGMDPELRTPYESSRVNGIVFKDYSFVVGKLITRIAASKYIGKRLKYNAWARKKDTESDEGYLRFVVKNSDGTADLKRETVSDEAWKRYEVISEVDSLATSIEIGIALKGKGGMLYDSPELFYESDGDWIKIPIPNADFEAAMSFNNPDQKNWHFEGVGYSASVTENNPHKGAQSAVLAYTGLINKEKGKQLFDDAPQLGELIEKEISNGVYLQLPLVLFSDDDGTYPRSNPKALLELNNRLKKTQKEAADLFVRLGNVMNTYNVLQHFYPYFDVVAVDWSKELSKALSRSFTDDSAKDHLITLQKFTAPLKDGHVVVSYHSNSDWYTPPITWQWIEEKLVITNVLEREIPLKVGDIVTGINGQSTPDYFKEIHSRISAGTLGLLNAQAERLSLSGEKDSELNLVVNNKNVKLIRNTYPFGSRSRMADFEKINDSVYYLNLNSISMEDIEKLLPKLVESKSIICDLRVYPNSNSNFISYLLKENDTALSWMQIPQSMYPNREKVSFRKSNWMLPTKKPYLGDKQIIFMTKGTAISYAESFMGFIRGYNLATIIGQPTAGTNGNVNRFKLSDGFSIRFTGMKVLKHDGSQLHGIGFLPDIYVKPTIEGMKAGTDEFLAKAIELTQKK